MLSDPPFVAVDLETTGLYPGGHDRIVEIALVPLPLNRDPAPEYVTLLNPGRDIGPTRIHGIAASDVIDAPTFRDVAGDLISRIAGSVLVAHNARFDAEFLGAEFERAGISHPPIATVCTVTLAHHYRSAQSYRLPDICREMDVPHDSPHTALSDARATAALFASLRQRAHAAHADTLADLGCTVAPAPVGDWLLIPARGVVLTRRDAHERSRASYLEQLVERLVPAVAPDDHEALEYFSLLDRVLEDRVVTDGESERLFETARRWNLSRERVLAVHRSYLASLVAAALADGVITAAEKRDLEAVTQLFGFTPEVLAEMLKGSPPFRPPTQSDLFTGLSVCFSGDSQLMYRGGQLSREMAHELATKAGLITKNGVSKRLDLLVVADGHSLSGKAVKARSYGTRIIAEKVFWDALGVPVQ